MTPQYKFGALHSVNVNVMAAVTASILEMRHSCFKKSVFTNPNTAATTTAANTD